MLFCGVFRLSRTSRPQERLLGISHNSAKYRISVKDQVRPSKTHNIIWRSLHFMDKGFQPLRIGLTVSVGKRDKFSPGILHTKVSCRSNILFFVQKKCDRIFLYNISRFVGGHTINDNNLVRISRVI
ncbi:hypothetical protein MSVAZ_0141 [Methanosarcina vacuolata Z-761]|uniref:Uncharacterized protein n=1 Tax=Methanosarcina vacuolata Z-761 TaxID=1434123 RepID=A0A0E3Q2L8_9EURY|nr:hypothetical protein MSVAZ_0141 [Methanosarcina vacuolata Z-761]